MPRPKDFTVADEAKRKRLVARLKREHADVKNPWAVATAAIRRGKRKHA